MIILALWIGLALAGWQTALATGSMQHQLVSPIRWIHFTLYSLGGFILLGFVFLIPGIFVGLLILAIKKKWDQLSIRRFLFSSAIGTGLVIVVGLLKAGLVKPVISSHGFVGEGLVMVFFLIFLAYIIGTALAFGILQILESKSACTQWSVMWGWWLFMVIVPPIGVILGRSAESIPSLLLWILVLIIAGVVFFILLRFLPRFYNWMQGGRAFRWTLATALLALIYILTISFPRSVVHGQPADGESPPIVLITIDTLRPDALDCYPEGDCTRLGTPNINRIAEDGVVFERAWSTAPWTVPSVGSILSGLPPGAHGAEDDASSALTGGATTLAEILGESGYVTGGVVVNSLLGRGSGMDQGFDSYEEEFFIQQDGRRLLFQRLIDRFRLTWPEPWTPNQNPVMERDAVVRSRRFIREHSGERFFLWLHLFAPHSIWYPPREYRERAADELGIEIARSDVARQLLLKDGTTPVSQSIREGVLALYAGEVAFADDSVGGIIEELENLEIFDDCLFIITSDHGEEFFEHDRIEHAHSLYPELLHVPLIMSLPGKVPANGRIPAMVSLVDLAPTILELAGVEARLSGQQAEFTGRSFVSVINNPEFSTEPIFFEDPLLFDREVKGVVLGDYYYIGGEGAVLRPRLYNLEADPDAWYDILRKLPEVAERMATMLELYEKRCDEIAERLGAGNDATMRERFRSLGYLN